MVDFGGFGAWNNFCSSEIVDNNEHIQFYKNNNLKIHIHVFDK